MTCSIHSPVSIIYDADGNEYTPSNPFAIMSDDSSVNYARGAIPGTSVIRKFGHNEAVGATAEAIWTLGGLYPFPTAADNLIIQSNIAADDVAGAGARKIVVVGLGEQWQLQSETVELNGAGASAQTAFKYWRIFRAYNDVVGTYGVANTALVEVEDTAAAVLAQIEAGLGQTQMAIVTVPAGCDAWLKCLRITVETGKGAGIKMWRRERADEVSGSNMGGKRIVAEMDGLDPGLYQPKICAPIRFPEKTDVWIEGIRAGGSDVAMTVEFDLLLRPM